MAEKGLWGKLGQRFSEAIFEGADEEAPVQVPDATSADEAPAPAPRPAVSKPVGDVSDLKADLRASLDEEVPRAYTVFQGLLSSLEAALPDETSRIRAALATAPQQGVSQADIVSAFEERLVEVDEWEEGFRADFAQRSDQTLSGLQTRREELDQTVEQTEAEIEQLRESLTQLRVERDAAGDALAAETENLASHRRRMERALQEVRSDLAAERDSVFEHIDSQQKGETS